MVKEFIQRDCSISASLQGVLDSRLFDHAYACAMARGRLWRRSESGSAAMRWKRLPASRNPIPSSAGIEDSLPTGSTAQRSANLRVGRELAPRHRIGCYVWRERTPAGVTTAFRDTKFCASFRGHPGRRRSTAACPSGAQPQFKCFRGTMGALRKGRVFVQVDSLWRNLAAARRNSVHRALSRRTESPG